MPTDPAVSVWTCDFCGVEVHVSSDRCNNCGGEHAAPVAAAAEVASPLQPSAAPVPPSAHLSTGLALFGLFLLLGGFAFGLQTERILAHVAHFRWSQQHALAQASAARTRRPAHPAATTTKLPTASR